MLLLPKRKACNLPVRSVQKTFSPSSNSSNHRREQLHQLPPLWPCKGNMRIRWLPDLQGTASYTPRHVVSHGIMYSLLWRNSYNQVLPKISGSVSGGAKIPVAGSECLPKLPWFRTFNKQLHNETQVPLVPGQTHNLASLASWIRLDVIMQFRSQRYNLN